MNNLFAQALTQLFDQHRIVFWYDTRQELCDDFETLSLPNIEKSWKSPEIRRSLEEDPRPGCQGRVDLK
jgi:hypothetical protein